MFPKKTLSGDPVTIDLSDAAMKKWRLQFARWMLLYALLLAVAGALLCVTLWFLRDKILAKAMTHPIGFLLSVGGAGFALLIVPHMILQMLSVRRDTLRHQATLDARGQEHPGEPPPSPNPGGEE